MPRPKKNSSSSCLNVAIAIRLLPKINNLLKPSGYTTPFRALGQTGADPLFGGWKLIPQPGLAPTHNITRGIKLRQTPAFDPGRQRFAVLRARRPVLPELRR